MFNSCCIDAGVNMNYTSLVFKLYKPYIFLWRTISAPGNWDSIHTVPGTMAAGKPWKTKLPAKHQFFVIDECSATRWVCNRVFNYWDSFGTWSSLSAPVLTSCDCWCNALRPLLPCMTATTGVNYSCAIHASDRGVRGNMSLWHLQMWDAWGHRSRADDLVGAAVNSVNSHYTRCAERLMVISQGVGTRGIVSESLCQRTVVSGDRHSPASVCGSEMSADTYRSRSHQWTKDGRYVKGVTLKMPPTGSVIFTVLAAGAARSVFSHTHQGDWPIVWSFDTYSLSLIFQLLMNLVCCLLTLWCPLFRVTTCLENL